MRRLYGRPTGRARGPPLQGSPGEGSRGDLAVSLSIGIAVGFALGALFILTRIPHPAPRAESDAVPTEDDLNRSSTSSSR